MRNLAARDQTDDVPIRADVDAKLDQATADLRYVNVAGDKMTAPLEIESQTQATLTIDALTPPTGVTGSRIELQRDGVLRWVLCTLQEDGDNLVLFGRRDDGSGDNYALFSRSLGRLTLNGPVGTDHYIALDSLDAATNRYTGVRIYRQGLTRWIAGKDSATETGANVGSDYVIRRYSDTGSTLDNALRVVRSTGEVVVANDLTTMGKLVLQSSGGSFGGSFQYLSSNVMTTGGSLTLSDTGWLRSKHVYDNTSGSAANVVISSGTQFYRSSSTMRIKHAIAATDGQTVAEVPYDRTLMGKALPPDCPDPMKVLDVQPVTYVSDQEVDGFKRRVGLLTENVATHCPWAVNEDTPDWNQITASLLHVVKEQSKRISDLEARVAALEAKV